MSRSWHVGRWGALGWAETAVKLAAIVVAVVGATRTGSDGVAGQRWAVVVLLAIATLGLVGAIADRLVEREAIAMAFVICNVAGHLAILDVARSLPWQRGTIMLFALLMLVGELIKLRFLTTSGYRVRQLSPGTVLALTGGYAVLYAIVGLLALSA